MELFDIVDENGIPTGKTVERQKAHSLGIRHRTAHIWISRRNGDSFDLMLQKRAEGKDSFPGKYDTSSAGHIRAGDEPLASALRELKEELGICAAEKELTFAGTFVISYETEFYGKKWKDNEISFVYSYTEPVDTTLLKLQREEVEGVAWFPMEEVYAEVQKHNEKFCVPLDGLRLIRNFLLKSEDDKVL